MAYSLLQAGNWVCEEAQTPVKEFLPSLIKVWGFVACPPAVRLYQACSGPIGLGRTKTETIGAWWMDPDSFSRSETSSVSLGVNPTALAWPCSVHRTRSEETHGPECLQQKDSTYSLCVNQSMNTHKHKQKPRNNNLPQLISNSAEPDWSLKSRVVSSTVQGMRPIQPPHRWETH